MPWDDIFHPSHDKINLFHLFLGTRVGIILLILLQVFNKLIFLLSKLVTSFKNLKVFLYNITLLFQIITFLTAVFSFMKASKCIIHVKFHIII